MAKKILLLVDLSVPPPKDGDYSELLKTEEWKNEAHLFKTLKKLDYEVKVFGLYKDIEPLLLEIKENRPDLVFNLCEGFNGDRHFEPHIVDLLELAQVKYTGAPPTALRICKDKGLTKKILAYHKIRVPRFLVSKKSQPLKSLQNFHFPAFIKPLELEASEGIAQLSLTHNEKDALERIQYIHHRFNVDAIIEEYIEGRELYVGVMGNERLTVFPPRELFFKEVPEGEPKFATFKAKWDEAYRKKWGIDTGVARALSKELEHEIIDTCKKVYRFFQLKGYARIDLRVNDQEELFFIEANPNPAIAKDEDFALAAEKSGLPYDTLVGRIIALAES